MVKQSLVALDTDHIHGYVFDTNRLQEIRGASSILDTLNRTTMVEIAEKKYGGQKVFANGGAGLFLIEGNEARAEEYGQHIQREYRKKTDGGASINFAVQELPDGMDAWGGDTRLERELLSYKLAQKKNIAPTVVSLPSHPFLRPCSACGTRNAEHRDPSEANDPASQRNRYCGVCWRKRQEDGEIKDGIDTIADEHRRTGTVDPNVAHAHAWARMIGGLSKEEYKIPEKTERPPDFNELRGITGGKDYLALVYADGNGMGQVFADLETLKEVRDTAKTIDDAVYAAMSAAVNRHLQVVPRNGDTPPRFPFDMLMMGGDDAIIVTPAPQALDVALTLAEEFHVETKKLDIRPEKKGFTLSIGVVFAPVKYPFALLHDLAYDALKHAKKEGANRKHLQSEYGDTYINFMSVTGSASLSFRKVYQSLYNKHVKDDAREVALYATLRPYTVEELEILLKAIRAGRGKGLGRTKLHQVREAVLKMNLTTSVYEGMAVLNNWQAKQRDFVMQHVNILGKRYQEPYYDEEKPGSLFQRVTFPWFGDGPETYRTSLLDFVELYDFVAQEEVADAD